MVLEDSVPHIFWKPLACWSFPFSNDLPLLDAEERKGKGWGREGERRGRRQGSICPIKCKVQFRVGKAYLSITWEWHTGGMILGAELRNTEEVGGGEATVVFNLAL